MISQNKNKMLAAHEKIYGLTIKWLGGDSFPLPFMMFGEEFQKNMPDLNLLDLGLSSVSKINN